MASVVGVDYRIAGKLVRSFYKEVAKGYARGALAGAHRGRAIIVKRTPVDQGQLKASWKVRGVQTPTDGARVIVLAELKNDAPHGATVELGARPHKVSAAGWAAIYEWVRRHPALYVGSGRKGNPMWQGPNVLRIRATPKNIGPLKPFQGPDPQISAITNAIVWKLGKQGQKPTYFVRNSIPELEGALKAEIDRELALVEERARRGGR